MSVVSSNLTRREVQILQAVSQGRCETSGTTPVLLVDGLLLADQMCALRLIRAGLIAAPLSSSPAPARLTPAGSEALNAA